jgi:broad specificity phosphatase PhoE
LYILRHGQTKNYRKKPFNGWTDVPLTAEGKRQLDVAVAALKGVPFTAVYASDLSRARYGGEALAKQTSLPLRTSAAWREMNFGSCEGLSFTEIQAKYPSLAAQILNPASDDLAFPEGESDRQFKERIAKALADLCDIHPWGIVALVCHSGVGRAILAELLGLTTRGRWSLAMSHAGLHVVDIYPDGNYVARVINAYLGPEGYYQRGPGWTYLAFD